MKNKTTRIWVGLSAACGLWASWQGLFWLVGGLVLIFFVVWMAVFSKWRPIIFIRSRDWLRIPLQFLGLFFLAIILRVFCFEIATVPSASMRNTLLEGDRVVINQLTYGPRLPRSLVDIPWVHPIYLWTAGSDAYRKKLRNRSASRRLRGSRAIQRGDVLVFNYPKRKEILYVKRCLGLPGDSLEISKGQVYINHQLQEEVASLKNPTNFLDPEELPYVWPNNDFRWNRDQFGPVWIPKRGIKIELGPREKALYGQLINTFERNAWRSYESRDTLVLPNTHVFQHDYYMVLGDNRAGSIDSRSWGFLPADYIKGRAGLVLFSEQGKWPRQVN